MNERNRVRIFSHVHAARSFAVSEDVAVCQKRATVLCRMTQENHCGNSCGMRNFAVRVASLSVSTPTQQGFHNTPSRYHCSLTLLRNFTKQHLSSVKTQPAACRQNFPRPSRGMQSCLPKQTHFTDRATLSKMFLGYLTVIFNFSV
jgi:hypothetical protein